MAQEVSDDGVISRQRIWTNRAGTATEPLYRQDGELRLNRRSFERAAGLRIRAMIEGVDPQIEIGQQISVTHELFSLYGAMLAGGRAENTRPSTFFARAVEQMPVEGRYGKVPLRDGATPASPSEWYEALDEPAGELLVVWNQMARSMVQLLDEPPSRRVESDIEWLGTQMAHMTDVMFPPVAGVPDSEHYAERASMFLLRGAALHVLPGAGTVEAIDARDADPVYGLMSSVSSGQQALLTAVVARDAELLGIDEPILSTSKRASLFL